MIYVLRTHFEDNLQLHMITYVLLFFKDFEIFLYFIILKMKFSKYWQKLDKVRQLYTMFFQIIIQINKNIFILVSSSSFLPLYNP